MIRRFGLLLMVAVALAANATAQTPVCGDILTFEHGLAPTREIHVATTGSNTTGDGSRERPYATIAFAARQAQPGNAVRIHPGEYASNGYIENLRGTAVAPIWIGGVPGEARPVIRGGSQALHIVKARYLIVHDLQVIGASANGINCDDGGEYANPDAAGFLIFRGLSIRDIGGTGNQDGLKLSGVRNFTVLNCDFARCGGAASGSGIDMVGCHDGRIIASEFSSMSGNAVQIKGGSTDIDVTRCRMIDAGERAVNIGGSTGFAYFRPPLSQTTPNVEAQRIRVTANIIEGSTTAVAFVGSVDSLAAHNTIINPGRWLVRILQETVSGGGYTFLPCGNNRFESNLLYFSRAQLSTHINIGANTAAATFTFANNLWYAHDNPAASAPSLPSPETAGITGRDPRLIDPTARDYRIEFGSPAAAAARPRTGTFAAHLPAGDIAGVCYAAPPSIGAYELVTCPPDCDRTTGPGVLDIFDFLCFALRFEAAHAFACDCDRSTGDAVCDVFDFLCFANAFSLGCP